MEGPSSYLGMVKMLV